MDPRCLKFMNELRRRIRRCTLPFLLSISAVSPLALTGWHIQPEDVRGSVLSWSWLIFCFCFLSFVFKKKKKDVFDFKYLDLLACWLSAHCVFSFLTCLLQRHQPAALIKGSKKCSFGPALSQNSFEKRGSRSRGRGGGGRTPGPLPWPRRKRPHAGWRCRGFSGGQRGPVCSCLPKWFRAGRFWIELAGESTADQSR